MTTTKINVRGFNFFYGEAKVLHVTEQSIDTVLGLLANNLILATIVPAAVLAVLVVHQERPGWLASVEIPNLLPVRTTSS